MALWGSIFFFFFFEVNINKIFHLLDSRGFQNVLWKTLWKLQDYPTRHVNDLNLTNNKFFSDHSIRTSGSILWNSLSKHWKNPKQLDISQISLNKSFFKIMIRPNYDFWNCSCLVWFLMVSVCFVCLFYFILFYFILFYFILFYFILFYFILFYLFIFILFYFILFLSIYLFFFCNLVCLRFGYLQALLAFHPTLPFDFLCFMLFDVMVLWK